VSQETGRAYIALSRVEREVRMRRPGILLRSFLPLSVLTVAVCPLSSAADGEAGFDEHVVVTSTRLDDQGILKIDVPASVTVVDREKILKSGARNLQDLLASEAGIVLFDQVGNDVQKTLDLRGFSAGKGIAVFVDGARVNDPRNNGVAYEQVSLDAIERIEITRGSAAALAGLAWLQFKFGDPARAPECEVWL
jgi:outer membrane cobalamin receptor